MKSDCEERDGFGGYVLSVVVILVIAIAILIAVFGPDPVVGPKPVTPVEVVRVGDCILYQVSGDSYLRQGVARQLYGSYVCLGEDKWLMRSQVVGVVPCHKHPVQPTYPTGLPTGSPV